MDCRHWYFQNFKPQVKGMYTFQQLKNRKQWKIYMKRKKSSLLHWFNKSMVRETDCKYFPQQVVPKNLITSAERFCSNDVLVFWLLHILVWEERRRAVVTEEVMDEVLLEFSVSAEKQFFSKWTLKYTSYNVHHCSLLSKWKKLQCQG